MRLVLDASVAIAATRSSEPSFQAARSRLNRALRGDDELVVPTLFGVEVAGALARAGHADSKIRDLVERLMAGPHEVVSMGTSRMRRTVDLAIRAKLRGADATYVALAASRRLPLCTLDHEMAARAAGQCRVMQP
jgi:predicted nucleic acid-binding protein